MAVHRMALSLEGCPIQATFVSVSRTGLIRQLKKNVTFHTARHSCAVLLLTLGADIYTVSKILGHRSVRATQVYAKIVDKKKDDAITLVDDAF